MPIVAIVGPLLLLAALVAAYVAFARWRDRKLDRIFAATRMPGARAHAKGMLCVFGLQCPAVASATDDELVIHSIFGNVRRIPLAHISLKQEIPAGHCCFKPSYAINHNFWMNKHRFLLECPEERLLALGLADPAPWREIFQPRPTSGATP